MVIIVWLIHGIIRRRSLEFLTNNLAPRLLFQIFVGRFITILAVWWLFPHFFNLPTCFFLWGVSYISFNFSRNARCLSPREVDRCWGDVYLNTHLRVEHGLTFIWPFIEIPHKKSINWRVYFGEYKCECDFAKSQKSIFQCVQFAMWVDKYCVYFNALAFGYFAFVLPHHIRHTELVFIQQ